MQGNGGGGGREKSGGGRSYLLEVTIISAQDLHRATASMNTYATASIDYNYTLRTRIDTAGGANPTWNQKFAFTVDDAFLYSPTSAVNIDVWAKRNLRRRDSLLGTARILLSAADPLRPAAHRFYSVMVRRPRSLRPQGILDVGIVLLDPARGSNVPSEAAVGHEDLVADGGGGGDSFVRHLVLRMRPSPSYTPVGSENGSAELREKRKSAEELKALESKLEKWRAELPSPPPPPAAPARRRRRTMSCFSFGGCCAPQQEYVI